MCACCSAAELGALAAVAPAGRRRAAIAVRPGPGSCRSSGSAAAPRSCGSRRRCATTIRRRVAPGCGSRWPSPPGARVAHLPPPLVAGDLDRQPRRAARGAGSCGSRRRPTITKSATSRTIGRTIPAPTTTNQPRRSAAFLLRRSYGRAGATPPPGARRRRRARSRRRPSSTRTGWRCPAPGGSSARARSACARSRPAPASPRHHRVRACPHATTVRGTDPSLPAEATAKTWAATSASDRGRDSLLGGNYTDQLDAGPAGRRPPLPRAQRIHAASGSRSGTSAEAPTAFTTPAAGIGRAGALPELVRRWPVFRQLRNDPLGLGQSVRGRRARAARSRASTTADHVVAVDLPVLRGRLRPARLRQGRRGHRRSRATRTSPISRGRLCPKGRRRRASSQSPLREYKVKYRRAVRRREWEELAARRRRWT